MTHAINFITRILFGTYLIIICYIIKTWICISLNSKVGPDIFLGMWGFCAKFSAYGFRPRVILLRKCTWKLCWK